MRSLTSRTTLVTTLAVAGVLLAGTAAIAANIGILNSTNDSSVGSLSASDDLLTTTTSTEATTTTVSPTTTLAEPTTAADGGGSYVVDDAGTVSLTTTADALALVGAMPAPGWSVTSEQPDPRSLTVTFSTDGRTVVFTALLGPDGVIAADVTEPIVVLGPRPAATSPSAGGVAPGDSTTYRSSDDDHDEYEDEDDDHDDHDEYEEDDEDDEDEDHDDHDDHDEYEGADDDD